MARYFSREAIQQSIDAVNADPKHLELAKLLTGKLILRCLATPDGKDLLVSYRFERGRCLEFVFEEEPAPSALRNRPFKAMKDGIARVTASYATFVKLDKGEMDPADAINSPDYQIEGSMLMILPLMQAVDAWNRKIRSLPKEY
jgi:hypothetical protein